MQNVVTPTINQTSFMVATQATIFPAHWVVTYFCPTGYVATDTAVGAGDNLPASNEALTINSLYNDEEATTFTPGPVANLWFTSTGSPTVGVHATCEDGRVFGQAGPLVPFAKAKSETKITLKEG